MKGFHFLRDSIIYVIENKTLPTNNALFEYISERHGIVVANVERCLRTIIDKTWKDLVEQGLFDSRPSPRQFILDCAEHIAIDPEQPSAFDILFT